MSGQTWPISEVLAVVVTGIIITFIGLIVLIIFCTAVSAIIKRTNANSSSGANKVITKPAPVISPPNKPQNVAASATPSLPVINADEEDEIAAVIAATVAAMSVVDHKEYVVTGIKRIPAMASNMRPVWGQAGLRENTQAF